MNINLDKIGLKVSIMLLLNSGEVSKDDIRSMPFFNNSNEPEAVIQFLLENYNVEICTKKISSEPIPEWEEVIRLKK